jgi:hypothetical protein
METDVILSSIYAKLQPADQNEFIRLIGVANSFSIAKKAAYAERLSTVWKAIEPIYIKKEKSKTEQTLIPTPTPTVKLCKGTKKDGSACANKAKDGSEYCGIHGK